jgi:hypothetical protein
MMTKLSGFSVSRFGFENNALLSVMRGALPLQLDTQLLDIQEKLWICLKLQ